MPTARMRLDGQVAFVTGGGRGIGRATAHELAGLGAHVAICDVDPEPAEAAAAEIRDLGAAATAFVADVTRRDQVEAAIDATAADLGRLDILVTCAGVTRDNLVHKMTDGDWSAVIATHLTHTFLCAQAAQRHMVPAKAGRMVFLSSASALGNRGQVNYSAAKAGVQGMARTLALELGRFGITVNAVAPGFVETRMTASVAERLGVAYEQLIADAAAATALGRVAQPQDISSVIAFLAGPAAGYVTGQTLYVQGTP
jgi:3-oxoacyl-[acyl-carrier protein] reductase